MRVRDAGVDVGAGAEQRDRGEATNRVTLTSEQQVTLPSGPRTAARVSSVFQASLRMATVTTSTDTWREPGVGMIAELYDERATTLGVVVSSRRHLWLAVLGETDSAEARRTR